jgi:hypothetical protein
MAGEHEKVIREYADKEMFIEAITLAKILDKKGKLFKDALAMTSKFFEPKHDRKLLFAKLQAAI